MPPSNDMRIIWALALGGFIPFGFLAYAAVVSLDLPLGVSAVAAFLIWSLVILTFLGGIRWGMALRDEPANVTTMVASVIPCILGWFSLALPTAATATVLMIMFAIHGFWDVKNLRSGTLAWFAPVRITLTLLVCAAHAAVIPTLL